MQTNLRSNRAKLKQVDRLLRARFTNSRILGLLALLLFILAMPVFAQTITEDAKIVAADPAAFDFFGESVAVSGTTAVVGADRDDDGGLSSGSAYYFDLSSCGAACTESGKLSASDASAGDVFGRSVAVSGTTAVIGAPFDDHAGSNSGSAYVFELAVPFDVFDIDRSRVKLKDSGFNEDEFEVRGFFAPGATGDGIDQANCFAGEEVTVVFNGFSETIPADSFVREDEGCEFDGPSGGLPRVDIEDDGEFRVEGERLDLSGMTNPVPFELKIGDDFGETTFNLDKGGRFEMASYLGPSGTPVNWLAWLRNLLTPQAAHAAPPRVRNDSLTKGLWCQDLSANGKKVYFHEKKGRVRIYREGGKKPKTKRVTRRFKKRHLFCYRMLPMRGNKRRFSL